MIIAGFDIASYKTGYFFLDIENINFKIGLIEAKGNNTYDRVRQIHYKSKTLLDLYKPSIVMIEDTYYDEQRKHKYSKKRGNLNTLKVLEKCHGAIISNTKDWMDIYYLTPTEHKEILTGIGNAQKTATIWAIQKKLGLVGIDDNMSDAAALVFAYLIKNQQWSLLEKIKQKYEA